MNKKKIIIIISFVLWFSLMSYSHGLKLKVEMKSPCVLVESLYHGGTAIGDAEVKVFFNDVEKVFQEGRADKNGKFSFIPDRAGVWYFQVDDGMGHRKRIKIEIGDDFFKPAEPVVKEEVGEPATAQASETGVKDAGVSEKAETAESVAGHSHGEVEEAAQSGASGTAGGATEDGCIYCKILLGLVLIFAFTFIFYTYKRKKEIK